MSYFHIFFVRSALSFMVLFSGYGRLLDFVTLQQNLTLEDREVTSWSSHVMVPTHLQ